MKARQSPEEYLAVATVDEVDAGNAVVQAAVVAGGQQSQPPLRVDPPTHVYQQLRTAIFQAAREGKASGPCGATASRPRARRGPEWGPPAA